MGEAVISGYVERRESNGRMVTPLPGKHTITQADASTLAKRRWEKYRRAAADGIAEQAAALGAGRTPFAAWSFVIQRQYTTLLDSERPRFDDVYRLGQLIGAVPLAGELQAHAAETQPQTVDAAVLLAADIAGRILARLLQQAQPDTIEGTVTDAE